MKKIKQKTHKSTAKRFKARKSGSVAHEKQGSGNGHSRNYMNGRQKKARKSGLNGSLASNKERNKILRLLGIR